jgi:hypothetical protein
MAARVGDDTDRSGSAWPRRWRSDIAKRQGNDLVAGLGFDALDLSAVAKPSKRTVTVARRGEAGDGERIEGDGLFRGT